MNYMGWENATGLMVEYMRENGVVGNCMGKENKLLEVARRTKVNISKIKSMAMEFIPGQMERNMMGNGRMESSMVLPTIQMRKESRRKAFGCRESAGFGSMKMNNDLEYIFCRDFQILSHILSYFTF